MVIVCVFVYFISCRFGVRFLFLPVCIFVEEESWAGWEKTRELRAFGEVYMASCR
jgi:hypothetical protein